MTIGQLKKQIAELDDGLGIEIIALSEDADGDDIELNYALLSVEKRLDPDTAEDYARFECIEAELE